MAEDNPERELGALGAEQVAPPTQTSIAVPTTGSTTTTPAGYTTTTQANDIVATVNALVVDVAAILTYLGTIHTAASDS